MDLHAPDDSLEHLKSLTTRPKESRFTILLTGNTTVNTSSATNLLSNTRILHVDISRQDMLEIVICDRTINDLPCRIITLPNLYTIYPDTSLNPLTIEKIRAIISPIHCIWFATRLQETSLHLDEQNVIKWLTIILGEQFWNYALLIFTHSNTAKDRWQRATLMKKRSEKIRAEIAHYAGWDVAAGITSVPVTTLDEITLDGKKWLPEFYAQIMRHSDPKGIAASVKLILPLKKVHYAESGPLPGEVLQVSQVRKDRQEDKSRLLYSWHTLTRCYLWSAPVGVLGMSLWGYPGFFGALICNFLFWLLFVFVRTLQPSKLG